MADKRLDTKSINRRKLKFQTIAELRRELERIATADAAGTLKVSGNWTCGQILAHLAAWIDYGWDGYPVQPPPFFLRWLVRIMAKRWIRNGMPAGGRIPGVKEGTYGQEEVSFDEGLARLNRSLDRLEQGELARFDSPAAGPLSHDDRIQLNLRHAELHLSFIEGVD